MVGVMGEGVQEAKELGDGLAVPDKGMRTGPRTGVGGKDEFSVGQPGEDLVNALPRLFQQ